MVRLWVDHTLAQKVYIFCVKKEAANAAKAKENCLSPKHSDELFSFSGIATLLAQKNINLDFLSLLHQGKSE